MQSATVASHRRHAHRYVPILLGHILQIQAVLAHCNLAHFARKMLFRGVEAGLADHFDVEAVDGLFHHLFRLRPFPERLQMDIPVEWIIAAYCPRLTVQALYQA